MKQIVIILSIFYSINIYAQDIEYARDVLATLCSEEYDGRGYYNNGERKSAEYIAQQFTDFGLKKFDKNYFQEFKLSVNSIVGETKLTIDGNTLVPGQDYLFDPSSKSFEGNSKVIYLTKEQLENLTLFKKAIPTFQNKLVIIDQTLFQDASKDTKKQVNEILGFLKYNKDARLNGVVEVIKEKLTYTASQYTAARPHIIVLKDKIPTKVKSIEVKLKHNFDPKYKSQNVLGYLEGTKKDSFICVIAHYDHIGRMGDDIYFPGANDNASGIAMMLSLAKELAQEENLEYSVAFIAFGSEEIGLVGSKYYTENPIFPLDDIKFLLNLDILGTGDDGIQVVNGTKFENEFQWMVQHNEEHQLLKQVKVRGSACNSDHCFFYEAGVPSFFIYTLGGIAHYHNIYDKAETLPLTEYNDLFILLKSFILR